MYKCPHCGKPGISVWRKLCLGPLIPAICKQCGNEVGVPYSAIFFIFPFIIATVLAVIYIDSITLKIAILAVVAIIESVIYLKYVPLIPK